MNALDVDEVVGQLLASEGFRIGRGDRLRRASRARLDRGLRRGHRPPRSRTARRDYLARIEAEHEAQRDASSASPTSCARSRASRRRCWSRSARTTSRPIEDLAGCATDELVGWTERQRHRDASATRAFSTASTMSRADAEAMIMAARVKAGWIEPPAGRGSGGRGEPRRVEAHPSLSARFAPSQGADVPRHEPERTCIVTRAVRPPAELIRFVLAPDGAVVPISAPAAGPRRLGDGAARDTVAEAVRRAPFARAFKAEVEGRARPRGRDRAGAAAGSAPGAVARQQGRARSSTGFAKVEAAIARRRLAALIHAARSGRGRAAKARGRVAKTPRRRDIGHSGRRRALRRRIGFGIGPVTCDTCCPRRGRRERRLSRALASAPHLSRDRRPISPDSQDEARRRRSDVEPAGI